MDKRASEATCEHHTFGAEVDVNRLPQKEGGPVKRYCADVRIKCVDCGLPFRFIGLPAGLDLNGAATSVNAEEARLAIAPKGQVVSVLEGGVTGFSVRNESPRPEEIARAKVAEFDRCSDTELSHADRQWLLRAFVEALKENSHAVVPNSLEAENAALRGQVERLRDVLGRLTSMTFGRDEGDPEPYADWKEANAAVSAALAETEK